MCAHTLPNVFLQKWLQKTKKEQVILKKVFCHMKYTKLKNPVVYSLEVTLLKKFYHCIHIWLACHVQYIQIPKEKQSDVPNPLFDEVHKNIFHPRAAAQHNTNKSFLGTVSPRGPQSPLACSSQTAHCSSACKGQASQSCGCTISVRLSMN